MVGDSDGTESLEDICSPDEDNIGTPTATDQGHVEAEGVTNSSVANSSASDQGHIKADRATRGNSNDGSVSVTVLNDQCCCDEVDDGEF